MRAATKRLFACGACALAASITVAAPCSQAGSHEPQRLHLKALLQDLAAQRGFKLEYWASEDPKVVSSGGNDVKLMTSLAEQANLIVRYAPAGPRCPEPWKIDTVWVLPLGKQAPSPPQRRQPPPSPDIATLGYLQAHGAAAQPAMATSEPAP